MYKLTNKECLVPAIFLLQTPKNFPNEFELHETFQKLTDIR